MIAHLFVYPGHSVPSGLPTGVTASPLPRAPAAAAQAFAEVLANPAIDTIVGWDLALGAVPWLALSAFAESRDDAWHAGARVTETADGGLFRFVHPLWAYRNPPREQTGAINWELDLRACVLRAATLRTLGGLDAGYDSLPGMARDLGLRMISYGAVCRQRPSLVSVAADPEPPSRADEYRLVARQFSTKWAGYALARSVSEGASPLRELRAFRASRGHRPIARPAPGALLRPVEQAALPDRPQVSVVLPTFGRYKYLAEVLGDLRAQTIRPAQILIADGNLGEDRMPAFYDQFADLPIEVIWHEEGGTCGSRNACLRRATGNFVWFVDDDSRFDANNLEMHLRAMEAYGADVSVGPAYTKSRPELHAEQRELACGFMDCGTTLVRREMLEASGGFDMEFNQYLAGEDAEIGVRFVRAGGLMVNNPLAKRFHYLAPIGGARRSKNNVHRWTRWTLLPRPVQSLYYTAHRHFEPSTAIDAMLQAGVRAGWRRAEGERATPWWRLRTLAAELAALPVTLYRARESVRLGSQMLATGPQIEPLPRRAAAQSGQR